MEAKIVDLGFSVADGDRVAVSFADGELVLRFVDWQERNVEHRFTDVLAFRWSAQPSVQTPRDDSSYEVFDSTWLQIEVASDAYVNLEEFAHYILCFNADKVLEVLARRQTF